MVQLAFLSTAHIHTEAFLKKALDPALRASVRAIWDDVPERGRSYAQAFNLPFEPDLDRLLADTQVQGWVICSENTRHGPLLEEVIPLGRPILCEKPLVTTAAAAARVRRLIREYGTPLLAGYYQPFSGANLRVKTLLEEERLGRITHATFRNAHHAAYGRWFDREALAWFTDPALAGGGALMDMGTHALHLLLHLLGPVDHVWAMTANLSGHYPQVEDYGVMQLRFRSGALGRVEAGWCFNAGPVGLEVFGSQQSLWNTAGGLVLGRPGEKAEPIGESSSRPDRIERLVAVIRGELSRQELAEDLSAALAAVEVMEAAYRSARSGSWQEVAGSEGEEA